MSDAAAAVCLERGAPHAIARVERFAMGADAVHITAGDPSGAVLKRLIGDVAGDDVQVDLIHAHGTGTLANDQSELNAIESSLMNSKSRPALYSHKGAIGHSLGAAGLVSIAISCMIHREGMVPANANLKDPLPAQRVELIAEVSRRRIKQSWAMAAGFGGGIAVVSLGS